MSSFEDFANVGSFSSIFCKCSKGSQGCTTCCILAFGMRENGGEMEGEWGQPLNGMSQKFYWNTSQSKCCQLTISSKAFCQKIK